MPLKSKLSWKRPITLAALIVIVGLLLVPNACANTPGKKTAMVSWTSSPGATSYNLYRGTATGVCTGTPTPYATAVSGTTFIDSVLPTTGVTIFYAVSAVNATGESACSAEASAPVPAITAQPPAGAPVILMQ
jgi:hypothetical protein